MNSRVPTDSVKVEGKNKRYVLYFIINLKFGKYDKENGVEEGMNFDYDLEQMNRFCSKISQMSKKPAFIAVTGDIAQVQNYYLTSKLSERIRDCLLVIIIFQRTFISLQVQKCHNHHPRSGKPILRIADSNLLSLQHFKWCQRRDKKIN